MEICAQAATNSVAAKTMAARPGSEVASERVG
jgi:hypothetical protein